MYTTGCVLSSPDFDGESSASSTGPTSTAASTGASETSTGDSDSGSGTATSASSGATAGGTSSGSETSTDTGTTTSGADATSTGGLTDGSTTADTTGDVDSTSTTAEGFDPLTLMNYTLENCTKGPHCSNGNPVAAFIRAYECFTAPVDPPFVMTRVGVQVRYRIGQPGATLKVYPFDPGTKLPLFGEAQSRALGAITTTGPLDFPLDPPIAIDSKDFCVSVEGGNGSDQTLALWTDTITQAPGEAFVEMESAGLGCDYDLTRLTKWYNIDFAHYCVDVDIGPP